MQRGYVIINEKSSRWSFRQAASLTKMPDRHELRKLQEEILAGIDAAKVLLRKAPPGSDERERILEKLNELRQALVQCEKLLDESQELGGP